MMSSLVPGTLFYTPGFNRKSTPTPATVTPDELDRMYGRQELDGRPWPYESPVHSIYDVKNTSTKMIILNNKYGQGQTRLRGYYTGPSIRKSERHIDPGRHSRVNSPRNLGHHERCYNSGTPYFEPSIKPDIEWTNQTERPAHSLSARSAVNPKRHLHCQVPGSTEYTDYSGDQSPRPTSRISRASLPPQRYFKEYTDLTIGEKLYLWSIEKIYNIGNLKRLKQEQYQKLLELETKKGQSISWKEYDKYMRYIQSANSRHYGTRSPTIFRARSAHSTRSESPAKINKTPRDDKDTLSRPRTSSSRTRQDKKSDVKAQKKREMHDKSDESHSDSDSDSSKSEVTTAKTTSKSEENTAKSSSKTDDEKLVKPASKRPTSKTSQGQGHQRPKSSTSKSTKSISPYATPSPYASRTPSAKSSRSSRPSSYKSNKSKTGSTKSSDKENTKGDKSEEKEVVHHREGIDRPKSRLGHPTPSDKDIHYFSDQSDKSNSNAPSPKKETEAKAYNYDSDSSSTKSTQSQKSNNKTHKAPNGTEEEANSMSTDREQTESNTIRENPKGKTSDTNGESENYSNDKNEQADKKQNRIENNNNTNEKKVETEDGSYDGNVNAEKDGKLGERGILPAKDLDSDEDDLDRRPNTELDKIEY